MLKQPEVLKEVAHIILNLRGQPQQVGIRYSSMKEAQKQFTALDKALRKPLTYAEKDRQLVELKGDTLTFVGLNSSIEAWSLFDLEAHTRLMGPQQ